MSVRATARRRPTSTSRLRSGAASVSGVVIFLAIWQVVGVTEVLGRAVPPFTDVVSYLVDPANRTMIGRALSRTAAEAAQGFVIGVSLALLLAAVAAMVPLLRPGVGSMSALVNAAPWVAMGPLLAILWRDQTPVIISTLAVFFASFVAFSSGLDDVELSHQRVFAALGASSRQRLLRLQLPGAVPALVDGLRLAVPAAMLGAIFGEWFGATRGLGILLVSSMQNLRIDQLWAAATLAAIISLAGYGLLTVVHTAARARFS